MRERERMSFGNYDTLFGTREMRQNVKERGRERERKREGERGKESERERGREREREG